jgi:hypothetical protein
VSWYDGKLSSLVREIAGKRVEDRQPNSASFDLHEHLVGTGTRLRHLHPNWLFTPRIQPIATLVVARH